MSIKKKLILSVLIMTLIPAVLIIILSALLVGVFVFLHPEAGRLVTELLFGAEKDALKFIIVWAVAALGIVTATAVAVQIYVGHSVLVPLSKISVALEHLKNGDLDYEFSGSGDRELREICVSFEELRLRLQRNVRMGIKKDNDRRMLLVNISHDIKTPVTSIKGYVEGIRDGVANTDEKRLHYLDTIYRKAESIEQMVDNLSIYSKLELGRMQYNKTKIDLFNFLRSCTEEYSLDLNSADMELSIKIPNETAVVLGDKEKLERVFANIITNAIKYKKLGRGMLKVSAEVTEKGAVMTFADLGRGIAEEDLNSIFDEFYRADPSRNASVEGNGLGLSICKRIVADHGGKIWARSKLGEGCEISIFLPYSVEQKEDNK